MPPVGLRRVRPLEQRLVGGEAWIQVAEKRAHLIVLAREDEPLHVARRTVGLDGDVTGLDAGPEQAGLPQARVHLLVRQARLAHVEPREVVVRCERPHLERPLGGGCQMRFSQVAPQPDGR